jgi:hypothetical protein
MPQVDLEALVSACAGGSCDRKIACETISIDDEQQENNQQPPPENPYDPPESFWLSKDAEYDWFDRNAFYERKDSHKGNNSANLNPGLNPNPSSTSQRFGLKSKASIIGLPKTQKNTVYVDAKNRKPGTIRLFPKRSASTNKSGQPVNEPGSPKVSCMGRVRSKRDRKRMSKHRQKKCCEPEKVKKKCGEPEKLTQSTTRAGRTGFFSSFRAIFRSGKDKAARDVIENQSLTESSKYSHDIRDRLPARDRDQFDSLTSPPARKNEIAAGRMSVDSATPPGEPVGLGGLKRYSSGRRSETWGMVGGDVA